MAGTNFGALVKFYRRRAKLTIASLSQLVAYHPSALSRIENGARLAKNPYAIVRALVQAAGLSAEEEHRLLEAAQPGSEFMRLDPRLEYLTREVNTLREEVHFLKQDGGVLYFAGAEEITAFSRLLIKSEYWTELSNIVSFNKNFNKFSNKI